MTPAPVPGFFTSAPKMLSLDIFLTRLMPKVPGCPEPTALQALLDAVMDFSDSTRAIRVTTEPIPLVAGQALYDLDLPTGTEPLMVVRAWVGRHPLLIPPEATRVSVEANSDLVAAPLGAPMAMLPYEGATFRLYPTPDSFAAGAMFTARLAIRPTASATQVMDPLFDTWRDAIVAGATYRLAETPGQAYTNLQLAADCRAMYLSGVSRARIEANRDMSPGHARAYNSPFA